MVYKLYIIVKKIQTFRDPNQVPGSHNLDTWPLHTPHGKEYLELHTRFLREPDKSKAVGQGIRTKNCAFWRDYLPTLVDGTGEYLTTG